MNCKSCGQPLPEIRLGVRLTPLKARIFDIVRRAGPDGVDCEELFNITLRGRGVKRKTLKSHLWQINDLIEDSDHKIVSYKLDGHLYVRLSKAVFTLV